MLTKETADSVMVLAADAGQTADHLRARLELDTPGSSTPTTLVMADAAKDFAFADDVWARVMYDLIVTARDEPERVDAYVASLVAIYFGRVASFVVENRDLTTERAEEHIERQAREFERLKPYLLDRWQSA
jgi:hypothetical protein